MNPLDNQIPEHLINPFVSLKWSWDKEGPVSLSVVRYDGTQIDYVSTTEDGKIHLAEFARDIEKQIRRLIQEEKDAGRKF